MNGITTFYFYVAYGIYEMARELVNGNISTQDKVYGWSRIIMLGYPALCVFMFTYKIGYSEWWLATSFWWIGVYLITSLGKKIEYFGLGFASVIFLSEFYEIPYYIDYIVSGRANMVVPLIVIPKLLFIFVMVKIMKDLSLSTEGIIKELIAYLCSYIPMVIIGLSFITGLYPVRAWLYVSKTATLSQLYLMLRRRVKNGSVQ